MVRIRLISFWNHYSFQIPVDFKFFLRRKEGHARSLSLKFYSNRLFNKKNDRAIKNHGDRLMILEYIK